MFNSIIQVQELTLQETTSKRCQKESPRGRKLRLTFMKCCRKIYSIKDVNFGVKKAVVEILKREKKNGTSENQGIVT